MPTTVTETLLQEITDRIVRGFQPERVILFGSQARGDATPRSDIDLLVVMPNGTDRRQTALAIHRLLDDLGVSIDIVVTTSDLVARRGTLVGTILRPALREGRPLYGS